MLKFFDLKLNIDKQDYEYFKIIWDNITYFSDYIYENKYRNIKLLLNTIKRINVDKIIKFKNKYGHKSIDILSNYEFFIDCDIPTYVFKNIETMTPIKCLYEKYGTNKHLPKFIQDLKPNIHKLTFHNYDCLFNMYLTVCVKRFKGFKKWGPGNNGNESLNLINHYIKHIVNGNENWDKYICKKLFLKTHTQYGEFSMKLSKHMKNRTIHTNGLHVHFSGLYDKILIIGRLDDKYELGISSCYIIHDENYNKKINNINKNACFKI